MGISAAIGVAAFLLLWLLLGTKLIIVGIIAGALILSVQAFSVSLSTNIDLLLLNRSRLK